MFQSFTIEISKTYFTYYYCPEAIMKKFVQLNCIVIVIDYRRTDVFRYRLLSRKTEKLLILITKLHQ